MHTTTTPALSFRPSLGVLPFHLGCNALVAHPNCGICNPALRGTPTVRAMRVVALPDLFADDGAVRPPCERYLPGDPCACGMH